MSRRVHWTKTAKGKKRWREIQKRGWAAKKAGKPRSTRKTTTKPQTRSAPRANRQAQLDDESFAYAYGHITCWIGLFAQSAGLSQAALTARLGTALSGEGRR